MNSIQLAQENHRQNVIDLLIKKNENNNQVGIHMHKRKHKKNKAKKNRKY